MISWADKIAFVGLTYQIKECIYSGYYRLKVKVCIPNGATAYGFGSSAYEDTAIDHAIEDGVCSFHVDWQSVERKITDQEWSKMAHL
jgi:hypothetical protein